MKGIRRPSPHPPRWGYDVVRASYRLSAEAKHVWRIINEFDTAAGCWASMPLLAKLTGMPSDVFVAHVGTLAALGLVARVEQGTKVVLFAALPSGFPDDAKLEREDKLACAERLDRHLAAELVRLNPRDIQHNDLPASESSRTAVPLISSPAVTAVLKTQTVQNAGTPAGTAVGKTALQEGSLRSPSAIPVRLGFEMIRQAVESAGARLPEAQPRPETPEPLAREPTPEEVATAKQKKQAWRQA